MKRMLSIWLVLTMLLSIFPLAIVSADDGDFEISGNKLIRYNGNASSVTVPAEVEIIGSGAFMNNRTITSVRFAGKVTQIQSNAFAGCTKLARVSFADKSALEKIGSYAFAGCLPMDPSWANSVKSVAGNAFDGCQGGNTATAVPTNTPPVVKLEPTPAPTAEPTMEPTAEPTVEPTAEPTVEPTAEPTPAPTAEPTVEPTAEPTVEPTAEPTPAPTAEPTVEPTAEPTVEPTAEPTVEPTAEPTPAPTAEPTVEPTAEPTVEPTVEPTPAPTAEPTAEPTVEPTEHPTVVPTRKPVVDVTAKPAVGSSDVSDTDYSVNDTFESSCTAPTIQTSQRNGNIVITSQPEDYTGVIGEQAIFEVVAEGAELEYKWQYSMDDGNTWKNMGGASVVTPKLLMTITETRDGNCYRCIITDGNGNTVITETAKIHAKAAVSITSQPEDYTGVIGEQAVFEVVAEGAELEYKWQYSTDGGNTWKNMGGASVVTPKLLMTITETRDGYCYRCIITDGNGNTVITETAKIHVKAAVSITSQPEDYTGVIGEQAVFEVVAEGAELEYKWQYSTDGGNTWKNMGGASVVTPKLLMTITEARDGNCYRCIITDGNGNTVITETAKIHAKAAVSITSQPEDYTGVIGEQAIFEVVAEGTELKYKWQYSTDGGNTWKDMGGASVVTPKLLMTITETRDGYCYRCIITDAGGNKVISDIVQLFLLKDEFTIDDIVYHVIDDDSVEVIDYIGNDTTLVVPAEVRVYSVTRIGNSAFEGNTTLTSIDLPDSIQTIGTRAFANCTNLSEVK